MIRAFFVSVFLTIVSISPADAGVTIHFKGAVENERAVAVIVDAARRFSAANGWRYELIGPGNPCRDPITLKTAEEYPGKDDIRGIVLYPDAMSEPLYLVFAGNDLVDNFIKTQFAGMEVHIKVIELLHRIEPRFQHLDIEDEGEYWNTGNRQKLQEQIGATDRMIATIMASQPGMRGPFRTPEGRMIDLVGIPAK